MSVAALKHIHNSDLHFKDYNAFGRLDDYERYCREMGFTHPKEYVELRNKLNAMRQTHAENLQGSFNVSSFIHAVTKASCAVSSARNALCVTE